VRTASKDLVTGSAAVKKTTPSPSSDGWCRRAQPEHTAPCSSSPRHGCWEATCTTYMTRWKRARRCRVGQADPVLVEEDQATEGAQTPEESVHRRDVRPALEMEEPLRDQHEVGLALTQNLVRDVNVTTPRVPDLWEHTEIIRLARVAVKLGNHSGEPQGGARWEPPTDCQRSSPVECRPSGAALT
jgi:hypothetical protein